MPAVKHEIVALLIDQGPKKLFEIVAAFRGRYGEEAIRRAAGYLADDGYISREKHGGPWTIGTPRLSGIITSNEIRSVTSNLTV
jgi:hypothetical protein